MELNELEVRKVEAKPDFKAIEYDARLFCIKYGRTKELEGLLWTLERLPIKLKSGKCFVAGGAVRKVLTEEKQTDIDFFFDTEAAFNEFTEDIESSSYHDITSRYQNEFNNTYSLTIRDVPEEKDFNVISKSIKVQAIKLYHSDIPSLMDSFDFTICQFALDIVDETEINLLVGPYSLYDLANKRLHVHKVSYGVSTARRIIKYTNKGYTACQGMLADFLGKIIEDPGSVEADIEYID